MIFFFVVVAAIGIKSTQRFNATVHIVIDEVSGVGSPRGAEVWLRFVLGDIIFHCDKMDWTVFAATCVFALANVICFYAP